MQVDLVSPLPREECARRLKAAVSSVWTLVSSSETVGNVSGDGFTIRKRIGYRNSFQPVLHGTLADDAAGGTRVGCLFKTLPLTPVLIAAGIIILLVFGMTVGLLSSRGIHLAQIPPIALIAPLLAIPLFAGIGIGVVYLGRALARNEQQFLIDFVRRTLDAKEAA